MTPYQKAGYRLRKWRTKHSLSLKAAAVKTGVGYRTIHRFEHGNTIAGPAYDRLLTFLNRRNGNK